MTAIIREERIGGQRIILGDCLEVMKELGRFDAVVTDPPYGIDGGSAGYGRAGRTILGDTNTDVMGAAITRAMDLSDRCLMFYSARNTPEVMRAIPACHYHGEIIWDKKAPGMGRGLRYQHENIAVLLANGAKLATDSFTVKQFYRVGAVHPHEKPVELMEYLVRIACGGTILDPFMGSGTTLVACQRLGRMGTGVEVDPDYFDIACRRVEEATRQPDLFVAPPAAPTQDTLL